MKISLDHSRGQSPREFTDREEPRRTFWEKYDTLAGESENDVHVLNFYGIGGIGKSRLLEKLQQEMGERLSSPYYAEIDFKTYQDSRITLYNLRNKLSEAYRFRFPGFDMGYYVYLQKIGENKPTPESHALTEKSAFLSCLKTACGLVGIPVVNIASGLWEIAEKSVPEIRDYITKHLKSYKNELLQIEIKSADKLLEYLPHLFAKDMASNLAKLDKPFVFFIDTYEMLVNELMQTGDPLQNDLWIRDVLVRGIPRTLWVIAGREKLKWEKFDPEWKDAVESVLLGSLSPADSETFLAAEGVEEPQLRQRLCELTGGTPVYLNLCLDQYQSIKDSGKKPEISMFGTGLHTLVECFVRYMGDSQKDLIYMLACLQNWDGEEIGKIAEKVLPGFSFTAYDKVTEYSFISKNEDGYSLHQTVCDVLLQNCPELIRTRTSRAMLEHAKQILEQEEIYTPAYTRALLHTLRAMMILYSDREELCDCYKSNLQDKLKDLVDAGSYELPMSMIDSLLLFAEKEKDRLQGCILADKAYILDASGHLSQGKGISEKAVELLCEILGKDHPDTQTALNNLASYYDHLGEPKESIKIALALWERQKELFGEDDPMTVLSLHNLATYYSRIGDHEKALELGLMAYEKRKAQLGENNPLTLASLNNLAEFFGDAGRSQKAMELCLECLEKRKTVLGENHPDTLNSAHNLASYYFSGGNKKKALELSQQIWEKRKEILGENHPDTLVSLHNLSHYYDENGNAKKAIELGKTVWEKQVQVLGESHPETITSLHNLGGFYYSAGDPKTAFELAQEAYALHCKIHGEKHSLSVQMLKNLIFLAGASKNRIKEILYKNKLKVLKRS